MAIEFKELSYVYSPDMPYATKAIDDINLQINEGKITAIIGKTGSGKSTLIQHLNALLLPSSGSLKIADHLIEANKKPTNLKSLRRSVGLVFQFSEYQLFEETILKDVAFGPKNFGYNEEEAIKRAKDALKLVGLDESYYERSPLDISGGQKRRAAIAGILAIDPSIIVLDEPTAGLDPMGAKEMVALFCKLNKELHKTIILVTHDNEIVYEFSDEVVLIDDGHIIEHKDSKEFFEDIELLDRLNIIKPKIVELKVLLKKRGISLDNVYSIEDLAKLWGENYE